MTQAETGTVESIEEAMIRHARESFARLPTLEIIVDRLLLALVPQMKTFCAVAPEVQLTALDYMPCEDAMEAISAPSLIAVAAADPWDSHLACVIEPDLLFSVLEIMMGGRHTPSHAWKPRNLTVIEQKLGRKLADLCLKSFGECLSEVVPVSFVTQAVELSAKAVVLAPPRTATLRVRVCFRFDNRTGHMTLVLPYGTLGDIAAPLAEPFVGGRTNGDSVSRNEMNAQISGTEVTITGVLKEMTLPLHEVLDWSVGDIIDLGMTMDTPVVGMVNAQPMFHASFGQRGNGALALRVIQSLLPKSKEEDIADASGND